MEIPLTVNWIYYVILESGSILPRTIGSKNTCFQNAPTSESRSKRINGFQWPAETGFWNEWCWLSEDAAQHDPPTDVADFPEADFWTIFRGGGLADRLLVRITYGMAIYQHLSAPASRAKTSE